MAQHESRLMNEGEETDNITYWGYISLDTLLQSQKPNTNYPDEKIFIIYHQIAELYFKMILLEMEQVCLGSKWNHKFLRHLERINLYVTQLKGLFSTLDQGIEKEQFLKFRTALSPASGFQSFQYRLIQIYATDLVNLTCRPGHNEPDPTDDNLQHLLQKLYWRGGINCANKYHSALNDFDKKYLGQLLNASEKCKENNFRRIYWRDFSGPENYEIVNAMKKFDRLMNVEWPIEHLKVVNFYLKSRDNSIPSTGGTDWQQYLHPRVQKICFYPELWSVNELEHWGN